MSNVVSKYIYIIFLALAAILVATCHPKTNELPPFSPPNLWGGKPIPPPITESSFLNASEVSQIIVGNEVGPISKIHYAQNSGDLLIVTGGDGFLRRIDGETLKVEQEFNLGIISGEATSFSLGGELVLGARMSKSSNVYSEETQFFGDIGVWDTISGEKVACVDLVCSQGEPWQPSYLGASLNANGTRVLRYTPLVYSIIEIENGGEAVSVQINDPESDSRRTLCEVTFDPSMKRLALAYSNEEVELRGGIPYTVKGNTNTNLDCQNDLAFSSDGRLMAQLRSDQLTVWRLGLLKGKLLFSEPLTTAMSIKWSPGQQLIYVVTEDRLNLFSVETKSFVGELKTPSISAVEISSDNRLLFWGDAFGVIHVVAVSE